MRLVFLALLMLGTVAFGETGGAGCRAWVEDVSGSDYADIVHAELGAATGSVVVAMFEMRVPQDAAASSPVVMLVSDLIAAHGRGVAVKVVLNLRSSYNAESGDPVRDHANGLAADMLAYAGIDVSYFPSRYHMHQKLVVIDEKTVILGSHNWTYSGLAQNIESSSLIRSREHAATKLAGIAKLNTVPASSPPGPDVRTTVRVPRNFMTLEHLAPTMLTKRDQRPFDSYLLLRRYAQEKQTLSFSLDLMQVVEDIQIAPDRDKWARRKYAIKAVRTLDERYGLISAEFKRGKDAKVTLRDESPLIDAGWINVPLAYWTYGLATELKQAERHAYLICLNEEAQSITPPLWRKSQENLAKVYSISRNPINDGLNGLQRRDILSILRSPIPAADFSKRRPNHYRLKLLFSPAERAARWRELEQKHSPQLIAQARAFATMVDYGNDFNAADQLAVAITTYGYEAVSNVTTQVATKNATNPNRHPDTIVDYLRHTRRSR